VSGDDGGSTKGVNRLAVELVEGELSDKTGEYSRRRRRKSKTRPTPHDRLRVLVDAVVRVVLGQSHRVVRAFDTIWKRQVERSRGFARREGDAREAEGDWAVLRDRRSSSEGGLV
jgi:hypothetical protein